MSNSAQTVVRITLNEEIQEVLKMLKEIYPILTDAELFKVALGSHYNQVNALNHQSTNIEKNIKSNFKLLSDKISKRTKGKNLGKFYNVEEMDKFTT